MKCFAKVLIILLFGVKAFALNFLTITGAVATYSAPVFAFGKTVQYHDRYGKFQFALGAVTNFMLTYGAKYTTHSTNSSWDKRPNGDSFNAPSFEASLTFQAATFTHIRYGIKEAAPVYALAGLASVAQYENDRHDIKGIGLGALIGALSAYISTEKIYITPRYKQGEVVGAEGHYFF